MESVLAAGTSASVGALLVGCSKAKGSPKKQREPAPDSPADAPASTEGSSSTAWKRLRVGAGGYVTGIQITRDGTQIVRTDTHGAYIWDERGQIWRELLTRKTLPAGDVPHPRYFGEQSGGGRSDGPGCWEALAAPSNSSVIYAIWNAYCYKSTDRGLSFRKTALPRIHSRANDQNFAGGIERIMGPKMAVDPANANVVWASGDMGDGLWQTEDGGLTWIQKSGLPVPTDGTGSKTSAGPYLIVFDPSSPVSGGKTQGIYVASYGHGLFRSDDGGATFRAVPGAPTAFRRVSCDQLGRLWVCDVSTMSQPIRKYEKGTWTSYGSTNARFVDVAVNPANPAHIIAWSNSLQLLQSKDNGATWQHWYSHSDPNLSYITTVAEDIPWLAKSVNTAGLSIAAATFDPSTGRCYLASGLGVFYAERFPDTRSDKFELRSQSFGIEQLCVWRIMAPPGGAPITVQLDRSAMKLANPDRAPGTYGPNLDLKDGFDLDYSLNDSRYLVMLCAKRGNFSAYSTDGGDNWSYFAGKDQMSPSPGGSIAVSTPGNIVHVPSNNGVARYTLDGGKTWQPLNIPGLPQTDGASGGTGWGWHWSHNRKVVCADKARANVFYAYNYGPSNAPGLAGLWRSEDGGRNWVRARAGTLGQWTTYHAQLNSVPDNAGHLFFTAGADQNQPLYRSTDGGANWAEVAGFKNVISFGFGKASPQGRYPTIYVSGWLKDEYGIWRSTDDCATWTKIGDYPLDSIDMSPSIAGDPNIFGRCYVAFGGSGAAYVDSAGL